MDGLIMGTSTSGKGPKSNSPLVPPHADATPNVPLPEPAPQRFRAFRTEFGRVAAGTAGASLRSAIRAYAREATGGSAVGPRRLGTAYVAGSDLAQALNDLRAGRPAQSPNGVDLTRLRGQPIDYAAQELARALAPVNADAELVATAIQEAVAEALPDVDVFDPATIADDQLIQLLVEFFSRILFQEITLAAGDAWNKSTSPRRTTRLEADLLELIRVTVDRRLGPLLQNRITNLSRAQFQEIERAAIDEVWREWES
jgi:hypothetical protein